MHRTVFTALLALLAETTIQALAASAQTPAANTLASAPAAMPVQPATLDQAQQLAVERQHDVLVLVGAEWCGPCQTLKASVMPQVAAQGGLARMEFAYVDYDQQPELATALMHGNTVPQVVYLRFANDRWVRSALIVEQPDAERILGMIRWVQSLPVPAPPTPMLPPGPDFAPRQTEPARTVQTAD